MNDKAKATKRSKNAAETRETGKAKVSKKELKRLTGRRNVLVHVDEVDEKIRTDMAMCFAVMSKQTKEQIDPLLVSSDTAVESLDKLKKVLEDMNDGPVAELTNAVTAMSHEIINIENGTTYAVDRLNLKVHVLGGVAILLGVAGIVLAVAL